MKKIFFSVLLFSFTLCCGRTNLQAQVLSDSVRLSLLTIAPTNVIYNEFGHTALRIYDPVNQVDLCYNYGVYDFEAPNFVMKFVRGKLPYMMSVVRTKDEFAPYIRQQRGVIEQVFNLTPNEVRAVAAFLRENYRPENRYYMYDFIFDNCATRIRDLLEDVLDTRFGLTDPRFRNYITFRKMLDDQITNRPWYRFGFDFILGSPVDRRAEFREEMFLPAYLADNLDELSYQGEDLLGPPSIIIENGIVPVKPTPFTPMRFFGALFILALILTIWNKPKAKKAFDAVFYGLLTFCGLFLIFMRYGTDHFVTWNNWNLLWANPLYLFCLINLFYPRTWMRAIKWLLLALSVNILVLYNSHLQTFSPVLLPIIGIILLRLTDGLGLFKFLNPKRKEEETSTSEEEE
ncbi:MAG: DUF4105 domain-containing protein [Bacteroidota bacterium]